MPIKNVTVLGTGVLGSQIAFQAAFHGFAVSAYDISDEIVEQARAKFAALGAQYKADPVVKATDAQVAAAIGNLTVGSDLAAAVEDADLVIEAVPEVLQLKQDTYARLAAVAPQKTIFATNSSTLLPSDLKDFTGRPDRFLALHYANQVWRYNTAEIMGTPETDPVVIQRVIEFAEASGMEPIVLKKEKSGYVLNSLLVPLLTAAAGLLLGGYADAETVDRTWRIATGAPAGPFQIYDVVGLTTAYNIASASPDPQSKAWAAYLKENYIDKGKLGISTGEGFYKYSSSQ